MDDEAQDPAPRPPPLSQIVSRTIARAAEYSEPVGVHMTPDQWRNLADFLGIHYQPNSRTSVS